MCSSVRGPFGRPWPVEAGEGADVVIAAGGIGLPPLRAAILRMLARRERYGRLMLLYGGRAARASCCSPTSWAAGQGEGSR